MKLQKKPENVNNKKIEEFKYLKKFKKNLKKKNWRKKKTENIFFPQKKILSY